MLNPEDPEAGRRGDSLKDEDGLDPESKCIMIEDLSRYEAALEMAQKDKRLMEIISGKSMTAADRKYRQRAIEKNQKASRNRLIMP